MQFTIDAAMLAGFVAVAAPTLAVITAWVTVRLTVKAHEEKLKAMEDRTKNLERINAEDRIKTNDERIKTLEGAVKDMADAINKLRQWTVDTYVPESRINRSFEELKADVKETKGDIKAMRESMDRWLQARPSHASSHGHPAG